MPVCRLLNACVVTKRKKLVPTFLHQSIFACSDLAVTPSEKSSIHTNTKSTMRFLMSLIWTSYVFPYIILIGMFHKIRYCLLTLSFLLILSSCSVKSWKKRKTAVFRLKLRFTWRKSVCYKVSVCENCQQRSCKAFTGLSIRANVVRGERVLLRENLAKTDPLPSKTPIFNQYSFVAPQP